MDNNDYRRSLIMLRSMSNGYAGHARLEVRTLTASLNIILSASNGARNVRAAMVGVRRGDHFAVPLGTLRRDLRGQYGLSVTFDPRSVNGIPLEMYSLLVLADAENGCRLVCAGSLKGSFNADWPGVREAVYALYAPPDDIGSLPEPSRDDENPAQAETPAGECGSGMDRVTAGSSPSEQDETTVEAGSSERDLPFADGGRAGQDLMPVGEGAAEQAGGAISWGSAEPVQLSGESGYFDLTSGNTAQETPAEPPAAEEAALPEGEDSPSRSGGIAAPADDPSLREPRFSHIGWKFARVSLPEDSPGYAYIGMPDVPGAPEEICCAVPGRFSQEPPQGMDGYEWSGGRGEGWWVRCSIPRQ